MARDTGVDGWLAAVATVAEKGNKEAENLSWLGIRAYMIQGADAKLGRRCCQDYPYHQEE